MRLLTQADTDTMVTLALCARMSNARKVMEGLRDRFEDPQADPQAILEYGLCRAVYLLNDPNDTDKGPHQIAAIQAFSRCLELEPRWWLPRFLRIELCSVVIGVVPTDVLKPSEHDLDLLLSFQEGVPDAPSYFLSAHAARLRARLRAGEVDAAVEEFTAAAADVKQVAFALPYLDLPFRESALLLRHAGRHDAAEAVKATGLSIYPKSLPLQFA
jgi:hypothetical protein